MKRTRVDLEDGILSKYMVLRTKQLEQIVADKCYSKKSFTYLEAEQCENFHFKNDYKLNLIQSFWKDHEAKHILSYKTCMAGVDKLDSVVEKDKAYADCHDSWVKDFKNVQSQELEVRARQLFGKSLEEA